MLACLTLQPERIRRLFVSDKVTEEGIYAVKLSKNGEQVEVVVDDYVPCLDNKPLFVKPDQNGMWGLILEKAWAKLHGSYEVMHSGLSHTVFRDLTGAPSCRFLSSDDDAWDRI